MADAPDPGDAKDSAKGDTAPAAATPPDQGSAMELELSQALIELRRLTIFRGRDPPQELMARLEDAQLYMQGLREQNPSAATRGWSPKGRAWLARGASPCRMLEQRVLRATSWSDFTKEEVAAMSAAMRHSLTSRLAAKSRAEAEALAAEVSRRKKAEHQAKQITAAMEEAKKAAAKRREEALEQLATPAPGAAATDDSKWPPLPRPATKSEARGRTAATERQPRQRSKSAANKTGDTDISLSWSDIFANCEVHLRPLRGLQEGGVQPSSASFCRGTRYTELFGRTRPPLQARANAKP